VTRLRLTPETVAEAVRALRSGTGDPDEVRHAVADILDAVRTGGDASVRRLTARLDGVELGDLRVPAGAPAAALAALEPEVRAALDLAAANIRQVAEAVRPRPARLRMPQGHVVSIRPVPVARAGAYVPGGRAAYPSSALMALVPAAVAGVAEIAVCSPPGRDGLPDRTVLAVCAMLGVGEVYAVGGAQAVAALALGTETIRAVDLIVGPGNAMVGTIGIESVAGPSELLVLADRSAPPEPLAWDLAAQAEHGSGAQSVLVSPDADVLDAVAAYLPSLEGIHVAHADSWETAYAFVDAYAPEHLQLAIGDPHGALERVRHAGAVFLGASSGTAFGDYVAGSNHVLPTGGSARFSSALSPAAFVRLQEVIEVTPDAAAALAAPVAALARAEGLTAHARSALVRAADQAPAAAATTA
jgi:histidinol dehydrogenase